MCKLWHILRLYTKYIAVKGNVNHLNGVFSARVRCDHLRLVDLATSELDNQLDRDMQKQERTAMG